MTNTYQCIRCSFKTNRKSIIINHLNKKNKCKKNLSVYFVPNDIIYEMSIIPIEFSESNYQCKHCLKNFSCNFNLNRHSKQCNLKNKKNNNLLKKFNICNYVDIKKYLNNFYDLTILKYFEENKIYNSFYKCWNINHIDLLTKKLLFISNDKYSDLLRKILENDKNINIIYDKNESFGYLINDKNDIELVDKKKIVNETMKKIINTFTIFKNNLEDNDKIIDNFLLNKENDIINDKYNSYLNNSAVSMKVEYIILNLYYDKFQEIQNYALYDICNKNVGF